MDSPPDDDQSLNPREAGIARFFEYVSRMDAQPPGLPFRCPCCFCKTLKERGGFDIRPVCFWEDDGQDDYDPDIVRGGANGELSLTQARASFHKFSACDEHSIPTSGRPSQPSFPTPDFVRPRGLRRSRMVA